MKYKNNQTALSASNSTSLLADLIEQWERRCVVLDELVADAETTACDETIARLKTKAGVTRSMTAELKREIRNANTNNNDSE